MNAPVPNDDAAAVAKLRDARSRIKQELAKVVVGQEEVIDSLLIGMLCRGHILLHGVPGLGKTLMGRTLAKTLDMEFRRIQFTPDLMPADITGTDVMDEDQATGKHRVSFMPGPVFTNFLLADEINRTPPKTQAALLEAMQERHVTVAGFRHDLEDPFFVLATQNPIEQEGTYPLPEAQLDRFMLQIQVDYPSEDEELRIALETTSGETRSVSPVLHGSDIVELRRIVRRMPVSPRTAQFAVRLARKSRPTEPDADDFVKKYVLWG
ncbi:MAG TPA: AAA family ATPase, partial [Planctomycetaceae bacterium]|nr:AAA family ATPase [Planctomycetaceae bacterium]